MDTQQTIFLALLQGLTEFLPISSSAHLILLPRFLDWPDQGLGFDVAVHVGTLAAVIGYFRREIAEMARDGWRSVVTGRQVGTSTLAWGVVLGTIPVVVAGWFLNFFDTQFLRTPQVIAASTVFFALLLWWADRRAARIHHAEPHHAKIHNEHTLGWRDILIIGLAQVLALIPGVSRSGITLTAGLALGLTRAGAARFSFLLAIPAIASAGVLMGADTPGNEAQVSWTALMLGALVSGVAAYLTIHFFLRLLERVGVLPFVIYRLLLGVVLFFPYG